MAEIRRRIAKTVRHVAGGMPPRLEVMLHRLAHAIHPHVIRCRICGAEFISAGNPYEHATKAFDHWEREHG